MKTYINAFAAAAVALAAAAPAFAGTTQVQAGPGVSLTESAQMKFNRDTRPEDRHYFVTPGTGSGNYSQLAASAGLTAQEAQGMTLEQIVAAKANHETTGNSDQIVKGGDVTAMSRSVSKASPQFIASAGLTPSEAAGMTTGEIAAAKFERDTSTGDR